ncbi:MAG TPA: ABC-type transport auxiliary lipoprotein family protein [Burkholderiales bacterium]|nr:ABC-type transport auxiliary lipoprotein family protein [Burkholderiales bacterium]
MRTSIAALALGLLTPIRAMPGRAGVRNTVRVLLLCALGTGLAGCLPNPAAVPPQQYFVLSDLAKPAAAKPPAKGVSRTLLINPTVTSAFYDTQSMAYSRAAGQRGYYQFAGWTERPGRRFSELLMHRLEARGAFSSVAFTTAGIRGDVVLNTRLEELYQETNASTGPGRVVVEVTAEIVDYAERTMLARRRFSQSAATGGDNASAAVNAFNQAVTALLDEISTWVEATAAARAR